MNDKMKVNFYAFLTVLIWASAFPLTKAVGGQLSPYALGLFRCITASVFLLIAGKFQGIRRPLNKRDLALFFLSGGMGFASYLICFNIGMQTLSSATSSVIIALTPILTAAAAAKLYRENIKAIGWISIGFAFVGVVVLLFWNGVLSIDVGIIWTLAAAMVFCGYNLMNRRFMQQGYTSLEIVTWSMVCGTVLMLVFLPQLVSQISCADCSRICIAVYLGLMPSAISYLFWAKAISLAARTSEVTNYMFITPLLSAIMGFLMLGEMPDLGTFLGGAIIIASVVLFHIKGK